MQTDTLETYSTPTNTINNLIMYDITNKSNKITIIIFKVQSSLQKESERT